MAKQGSPNKITKNTLMLGIFMVILAALGFASKGILIKLAYALDTQVDAISLMAIRMLIALPMYMLVALHINSRNSHKPLTAYDWLAVLGLGFLGYYLSSLLDFSGLAYIPASLERMILYLYPTLVVIINALLNRRGIRPYEQLALAVAYFGMALMFMSGNTGVSQDLVKGSSLVFASALSFAVFLVASHHVIIRIGALRFTTYSMASATLYTLLHYGVQHGIALFDQSYTFYLIGLTMAIFCTVLPSYMMNAGIKRIGSNRAALISAIGPLMTLVLAYMFLDETLSAVQLSGMGLIIGSLAIVGKAK